ncbi:hypothetical protein Pelo_4209 [Pelomyxa schiedti]|nr:hypothetical protein Pelo_4209 [Pelomyxa schiedti]
MSVSRGEGVGRSTGRSSVASSRGHDVRRRNVPVVPVDVHPHVGGGVQDLAGHSPKFGTMVRITPPSAVAEINIIMVDSL